MNIFNNSNNTLRRKRYKSKEIIAQESTTEKKTGSSKNLLWILQKFVTKAVVKSEVIKVKGHLTRLKRI